MTDYAAIYEATRRYARAWAWRCGAETAEQIDDLIGAAWLLLLEARPALAGERDGGHYLRRCIVTAARAARRQERGAVPLVGEVAAPAPPEPVEAAVWNAAEALPGWPGCTHRERLALVLSAADWGTAEIAAAAPRLYPSRDTVKQATRRARRRIIAAMRGV